MDRVIVFDVDGVLVDPSESYREAIVQTVERLTGRRITRDLIQQYKNSGGWNNDWALSRQIALDLGIRVEYTTVVECFNEVFLGSDGDGLMGRERWFPAPGLLDRLAARFDLAIFTGRLHYELDLTLERFARGITFDPKVCSDDVTRGKPDPEGLHFVARYLPGRKLLYVGDTVDDARSARAAGVPFIGIAAPDHSRRKELMDLFRAENACAILDNVNEIESAL